jgi:hypothetical protein
MKPQEFVAAIRRVVLDASVADTLSSLENPPGRRPTVELVELSNWYKQLGETDRAMLRRVFAMVSHSAVFGFLAVLDGARAVTVSPGASEYFELRHVHGQLEDALTGPEGESLHELL